MTSTAVTTSSGTKQNAAKTILSSAQTLFAQKSFEEVSIQDIADHAGVSKANVFHHYPNKEALIYAVLQNISLPHAQFAENLLTLPISSLEKIRQIIAFEMKTLSENVEVLRIIGFHLSRNDQTSACECVQKIFQRNIEVIVEIYRKGQENGEFRSDFPPYLPAILMCGLTHLIAKDRPMLNFIRTGNPTAEWKWEIFSEQIFQFFSAALVSNQISSNI